MKDSKIQVVKGSSEKLNTIDKVFQLTPLQMNIICILTKTGSLVGVKCLNEKLPNSSFLILKSLDSLAQRKIITRDRASSNRRKIEIKLTSLGESVIEAFEENNQKIN